MIGWRWEIYWWYTFQLMRKLQRPCSGLAPVEYTALQSVRWGGTSGFAASTKLTAATQWSVEVLWYFLLLGVSWRSVAVRNPKDQSLATWRAWTHKRARRSMFQVLFGWSLSEIAMGSLPVQVQEPKALVGSYVGCGCPEWTKGCFKSDGRRWELVLIIFTPYDVSWPAPEATDSKVRSICLPYWRGPRIQLFRTEVTTRTAAICSQLHHKVAVMVCCKRCNVRVFGAFGKKDLTPKALELHVGDPVGLQVIRWLYHPPTPNGSLNRESVFSHCKEWGTLFCHNPRMKTHSYGNNSFNGQYVSICGIIMIHHVSYPIQTLWLHLRSPRLRRIWAAAATSCQRAATQWMSGSRSVLSDEEVGTWIFTFFKMNIGGFTWNIDEWLQ